MLGGGNEETGNVKCINTVEKFDTREGICHSLAPMKEVRRSAAAEHNGKIYVVGGTGGSDGRKILDTVEMFAFYL